MTANEPAHQSLAFGPWLKRLRAQRDLTQEALAESAYCSVQTIRFFESGRRRPSVEMAERLAAVLLVPDEQREQFVRQARASSPPVAMAASTVAATTEAAAMPEHKAPPQATARLPMPAIALIGRQSESTLLTQLLTEEGCRLVNLVGPGGIGKTRLALHMAHQLAGHFANGAVFVSLASISSAADLPSAIAGAMNTILAGEGSPQAQLEALLGDQCLLLVLDNFEHLLVLDGDSAIALVDHVVQHIRGVHWLITSRERLRVAGERVVELGGLAVPSPGEAATSDAVMLFLQRARQVSSSFALMPHNQAAVTRICTVLGGMPLAIELAAAWVHTLAPDEIEAEIARGLDFLTRADRSAPARHRSLRAVFDYSWQLLSAAEQVAAARLAIFRDGFQREAAHFVAGAGLTQLAALIDKSLVQTKTEAAPEMSGSLRYEIHELLRQFLLDKMKEAGEAELIHRRHAEFFTQLAERIEPHLYAEESPVWLRQLEGEQGNLRARRSPGACSRRMIAP